MTHLRLRCLFLARKARPSGARPSEATAEAVEIADLPTASSVPPLQRTLAVDTAGKVILEGPQKSTPTPEIGSGGPYDSKRRLRELIGSSGTKIPDDSLQKVSFYPSMGAQAVKYYFTPSGRNFPLTGVGGCVGGKLGLGNKGIHIADKV
ncbi:Uncharacterized protein Adt_15495 [Abeliophyllum distichum]|uniref:Uncharacterized protein n=1 Tax=Abeliophyllum distichum TaxID=126358 RepID=A0ABD1U3A2_9LAMI